MNIRKIIKEEISKILDKHQLERNFDKDIIYLKGFSLNKSEQKKDDNIWVFDHKEKDYTLRFYIQNNKINDSWSAKVFIYWKTPSKELTNAKGKDFEHSYGPFISYEEMIKELNRKLANNPLISIKNYIDDDNTQFDKDIIIMIKRLLKHENEISVVKDKYFDDLKKIYNKVRILNTDDELKNYIKKETTNETEKQTMLLILQKIYQLDFYLKKEKIEDLF